jgi:RHS repeat-associated protein
VALGSRQSDGSYVYGVDQMPVEQINSESKTLFLHHDQAGSTRLITGSTGTVESAYTYDAYGDTTGHTGTATTPLGYDGQYTSTDTGLVYLRHRVYDPATSQFLSVDPPEKLTRARYTYAGDNPLNYEDPTGLSWQICVGGTVSFGLFTLGGEACYVSTPGGSGLTGTGSVSLGPGGGANIHIAIGLHTRVRDCSRVGRVAHHHTPDLVLTQKARDRHRAAAGLEHDLILTAEARGELPDRLGRARDPPELRDLPTLSDRDLAGVEMHIQPKNRTAAPL